MPFGKNKSGLNLDCICGNIPVTVVTKCGIVFTGIVKDDHHVRSVYGCSSCFPHNDHDKHDHHDDCECGDKKEHCPSPHVEVKCDKEPKLICLKLTCPTGFICCDPCGKAATVVPLVVQEKCPKPDPFLFEPDDTVLINTEDICAIGPESDCPEKSHHSDAGPNS